MEYYPIQLHMTEAVGGTLGQHHRVDPGEVHCLECSHRAPHLIVFSSSATCCPAPMFMMDCLICDTIMALKSKNINIWHTPVMSQRECSLCEPCWVRTAPAEFPAYWWMLDSWIWLLLRVVMLTAWASAGLSVWVSWGDRGRTWWWGWSLLG